MKRVILIKFMDKLHPMVHNNSKTERAHMRKVTSKGELTQFFEGYHVLVARDKFFECKKLCLRWRGPRRVCNALSDYLYRVEHLRNGHAENIYGTRLKFYHHADLDKKVILPTFYRPKPACLSHVYCHILSTMASYK